MIRLSRLAAAFALIAGLAACGDLPDQPMHNSLLPTTAGASAPAAPPAVTMRWGARGSDAWTEATLAALDRHGVTMLSRVPHDIEAFCPGYAEQGPTGRRAFWAGLLSAVARHESTFNPRASGGGGKWLGLMQIAPRTWSAYGCSGEIMNGADNMACAVKIASVQVGRDGAVAGGQGAWRGVARDWMPLRSAAKRAEIAAWTAAQPYCARG